jgi:hypothetical protein
MTPDKMTTSLCPACHAVIPAAIYLRDGAVWMHKICASHGPVTALIEPDAAYWSYCQQLGCTNIYDGYMTDITDRCNLSCKYCYHPHGATDRPADDIISEAHTYHRLGPIILTGGEPTMHPDLAHIVDRLQADGLDVWVLTNGTAGTAGLPRRDNLLRVGLSFHRESGGRDIEFLESCRTQGLQVDTAFWVIDHVDQIAEALTVYRAYSDVLLTLRIKAASNVWAESGAARHIYISDMLRCLCDRDPHTELMLDRNNKTSFANVKHKNQHLMLISWYDINNVDLQDIDCGPYHRANDGSVNNFVVSGLLNAGPSHTR